MGREIKKRKKKFLAMCLALMLVFLQSTPIISLAASYTLASVNGNPTFGTETLLPGDELTFKPNPYYTTDDYSFLTEIVYKDYDGQIIQKEYIEESEYEATKTITVLEYDDSNYNSKDDVKYEADKARFKEWKIVEINASGDALYSSEALILQAVAYDVKTITYSMIAGATNDPANPDKYYVGREDITLAPAVMENYDFEGWYSDAEYVNEVLGISTEMTEDITLYGKFTPMEFLLSYEIPQGASVANPISYTYGVGVESFEDASKEGYTFDGWYLDDAYTTPITEVSTTQSGNLTLYAKFTANTYGITYELDGGTNGAGNPTSYTCGEGVASFADASKTGYTFEGWYSDSTFTTKVEEIAATKTGAITLYAKFTANTYGITYKLDGGTNGAGNPASYTYGVGVDSFADASKTGHTFEGWYSDSAFTTKVEKIPATKTGAVTLYAKFTANTYGITYELDGGTNGAGNPTSYTYGVGVASFADASKTGYTFEGWYSDSTFTTKVEEIAATKTGAITLYAKFTANTYGITYKLDGGTNGAGNPASYTYGVGVDSFADASKTGHTFEGWYSDSAFTTKVEKIPATKTGAVTLYAKFTANTYGITYELDGGTNGAGNPTSYTYGVGVASFADASKTGYTFEGWYSDSTFTTKVEGIPATKTGAVTLYAKFTKGKKQGTGSVTVADVNYGKSPMPVVASATNGVDNVIIEYKNKSAADTEYTSQKPVAVGEYTVKATFAQTEEYNELVVTSDFVIKYLESPEMPYKLSGSIGEADYYISDVTIAGPEGYLISDTLDGTYKDKLTISESTDSLLVYLIKTDTGEKTSGIKVSQIKIDSLLPQIDIPKNSNTIYGDIAKITVSDENLKEVLVNGEPVDLQNDKVILELASNNGEEKYEIVGRDIAGNRSEAKVIVSANWMKNRVIPLNEKVKLFKEYAYMLGDGQWKVSGDNTTYAGGTSFYVAGDGEYTVSQAK